MKCALSNVKKDEVKSWLGMYKTLYIATKTSQQSWTCSNKQQLVKTPKIHLNGHMNYSKSLEKPKIMWRISKHYLPSPNDQLMMIPDGSKMTSGIGHILLASKDVKRLSVRFHSCKIKYNCRKWSLPNYESPSLRHTPTCAGIAQQYGTYRRGTNNWNM